MSPAAEPSDCHVELNLERLPWGRRDSQSGFYRKSSRRKRHLRRGSPSFPHPLISDFYYWKGNKNEPSAHLLWIQ